MTPAHHHRVRRTATAIGPSVAVTTLAVACSGSSADRQSAAWFSRNPNLCVKNQTGSTLGVEFAWTSTDSSDNTARQKIDIGPCAIWYGLGADTTDMKNFFVTVTSPS